MSAHVHRFDRWGDKVGPAEPLYCECGASQTICETCGGDRVVVVDEYANGREHHVEEPCPDCTSEDVEDDDVENLNLPDVSDDRLKDPYP